MYKLVLRAHRVDRVVEVVVVKRSESFLGSSSGKSSPRKLYQRSFSVENPGEMTSSQSFMLQVETSPAIEKHFLRPQSSGYSPHSCLSFSRIFRFERSSFSLMPKCLETQEYQERDRFHLCSLDCHQVLHPKAGGWWLWRPSAVMEDGASAHTSSLALLYLSVLPSVFLGSSPSQRKQKRNT